VKLTSSGANNAFVTGKLNVSGTTLLVDTGTTLYASRSPSVYGCTASTGAASNSCGSIITVTGSNAGIVGHGVIDGQGGEPVMGQSQSWWDISDALRASNGSASNPALITVSNATNFVMHNIHIFNSPKFHVKLSSSGFIVWGVEVMTPSKTTNSVGTALTPFSARNTDGIDPGGGSGSTSNGYIVCSKISVGDDEIAIKGGNSKVSNLTIAHNHFGTGHGMSIGSETNAGVSGINVYDLTIDGAIPTGGAPASDINGLRIKSDASRGGTVDKVTYNDICVRDVDNPILLNPHYSTASGSLIPLFTNVTIQNYHALTSGVAQTVTLEGFDSSHISTVTLDNVVVDGSPTVVAADAKITIGPGGTSFPAPSGTAVTVTGSPGTPSPVDCTSRWVSFP
jgi:polygalacturonase